ncbi:uncharacterized protein EV420DRAFT_1550262 [Desarmillaria tabescens]|uniref:Uncharacterized protein n=1 Tax=Armillaria tabescens TaxID=1929756 RepID=A0AA39KCH7_ARMTA|nr:uncharacterized protein EV420DRAFT_1550262 [Desarmillaria tabescens]KAK0457331.1 hypothetical protein EV420DRAFT_1550262 [Desarmillaria tabescens]
MALIIALYADLTTSVPMFVSGALFLIAGSYRCCFRVEGERRPREPTRLLMISIS